MSKRRFLRFGKVVENCACGAEGEGIAVGIETKTFECGRAELLGKRFERGRK